jgi:hypothetical protein
MPHVGQDVFTIGHPKAYLWSFGQGVVAQIRPDYEWKYQDGILRSATAIQTQAPINPAARCSTGRARSSASWGFGDGDRRRVLRRRGSARSRAFVAVKPHRGLEARLAGY